MSATTTIGTNGSVLSCLNAYNGSVGDLVGSAVIQLVPIQLTTPSKDFYFALIDVYADSFHIFLVITRNVYNKGKCKVYI